MPTVRYKYVDKAVAVWIYLHSELISQEAGNGRERTYSVPNSSDGPIVEKRRAKDGHFLTKIRTLDGRKDRRNSSFCIKKARKFDSLPLNDRSA